MRGVHGIIRGFLDFDEPDWGAMVRALDSAARWKARWS